MQKTVLAVALASVFSMGSAYAATELSGSSTDALIHTQNAKGDYILKDDFKLAVSGDKALDYTNINLNGHTLTLSSSSTSETCWGVVNHSEISGKGTVIINQTGMNPGVGYMNKTSIAADKIIITSDNYYGVYAESNSHHTYDGNDKKTGVISVTSNNKNALYVAGNSTAIFKNFAELTITAEKDTKSGYAVNNNGGTLSMTGGIINLQSTGQTALITMAGNAKTDIVADKLNVTSLDVSITNDDKDVTRKTDAITSKAGEMNITVGELTSTVNVAKDCTNCAPVHSLSVKDTGVLNIKASNTTLKGDVSATGGTLNLDSDALTVNGNVSIAEAAKAPLTFSGANSALNGAATVEGSDNAMAFRAGARWVVKDESSVSNLVLDSGKVDLSQTDKNVTADKLTGKAGDVVLDAKGENTFTVTKDTTTKVTAVSSENADKVSVEEAKGMIDRIGGKVTDKNAFVAEGDYNGAISIDNKGNQTVHANTLMEDTLTLGGSSLLSLNRILMNDVRKRMGDVRAMEGTTGVWARYDGGRLSGDGTKNKFNTIHIGGDTMPFAGMPLRVGMSASYTNGDVDYTRGNADMDAYSLAAYGTWLGDNGMFADVIARVAKAESDMTVDSVYKGKLKNTAYSLSGEFGWRFDLNSQFYAEPQVEATYTYIDSDKMTLAGKNETYNYEVEGFDSFIGRMGVLAGMKCPNQKGDVYVRASLVHEFLGDAKINGGVNATLENEGKDTWFEYGIGANFNVGKNTYLWADLERTSGALVDEDVRGTLGVRYGF